LKEQRSHCIRQSICQWIMKVSLWGVLENSQASKLKSLLCWEPRSLNLIIASLSTPTWSKFLSTLDSEHSNHSLALHTPAPSCILTSSVPSPGSNFTPAIKSTQSQRQIHLQEVRVLASALKHRASSTQSTFPSGRIKFH